MDNIKEKRISMLDTYGENFQKKDYITNPAIGRDEQIKQLVLILLTPDKSAILTGKPGVGKTAVVEGLAWRIQMGLVPDLLKDYTVIKRIKVDSYCSTWNAKLINLVSKRNT